MADSESVKRIAIIPARSGSKGLPDKNIKLLSGKPLMAYSIEAAISSGAFARVFVSTDSEKYAEIAIENGADAHFLRSSENASDHAGSWDVVREVLLRFEEEGEVFDEVMLLQPTSPLRTKEDILSAISLMQEKDALVIESLTEMDHSPLWSNTLPDDLSMEHFFNEYSDMPRQSLPTYYRENGAIYLLKRDLLKKEDADMFKERCYAYIMPRERSIDIDVELDFSFAELILSKKDRS